MKDSEEIIGIVNLLLDKLYEDDCINLEQKAAIKERCSGYQKIKGSLEYCVKILSE